MVDEKNGSPRESSESGNATAKRPGAGLNPLDESIDALGKEALEAARRAEALEKANKERR